MASMGLITLAAVLLAPALLLASAQDPTPVWHPLFSVSFNETTRILFTRRTDGKWWYDWDNKLEVVDRDDGNGDRYCGSIHAFLHTPCRHLVRDGNRYLIFPDQGECCLCCTAEHGCGILSPTWLNNSKFEGQETLRGLDVFKWTVPGLQTNAFYATADEAQVPVELDQLPNDLQSFDVSTFDTTSPIPPELTTVPPDCHSYCPISSICTLIRQQGAAAALAQSRSASTAATQ